MLEAHTTASLAAALKLDEECLDLLLRSLVFCGYLELNGDRYSLRRLCCRSMVDGAPRDLTGFVQWDYEQWEFAGHLETLVRTGEGVDFHRRMENPEACGCMTRKRCWTVPVSTRRFWQSGFRSRAARRGCSTSPDRMV